MTARTSTCPSINTLPYRLEAIRGALRTEYTKAHRHTWLVAYSGGKDSTLLLQLVWETISELAPSLRRRAVLVVGNDTLVESPLVIQHLRATMDTIAIAAQAQALPFETTITEPCIDQTFWVNVIGRGYIPPTRNFRWCTDRMKILPTNRLIERITREVGGTVLLIGTRRAESQTRRRTMDRRGVSSTSLNPHSRVPGCLMFAPLADLADDDVWITLMQRRPPWGGSHRELVTLYRNAGGECPLVLSKAQAPSCGSSSPRFGCWTCTVVKKDRSLQGLITSGHTKKAQLEALFRFREWLITVRESDRNRLPVRRDGNLRRRADGTRVYGPFKIEIRREILTRLRRLEAETGWDLILPAEVECIKDVWWRDKVREDARRELEHCISDDSNGSMAETI